MRKNVVSQTKPKIMTFDAQGRILGRLASEIAYYLQGKHLVSWAPYKDFPQEIKVINIKGIQVTGKKEEQKMYWRHSGYPGGIYGINYKDLFEKDPPRVLYHAVKGMLPKNRLQSPRLKRLRIEK